MKKMAKQKVLDLYFLGARHQLIEIAAFLDRAERAAGPADFRLEAFREALKTVASGRKDKAKRVLLAFSDRTIRPVAEAAAKGATGAWNEAGGNPG